MKKRIKLVIGMLLFAGVAQAEGPRPGEVSRTVKAPSQYTSEGVYQSSTTCAGSTLQSVFISSPSAATLYGIDVTSPNGGATVEVWDGFPSTAQARRMSYPIYAGVYGFHPFNVSVSSWLGVSNQPVLGGSPACINILYRTR